MSQKQASYTSDWIDITALSAEFRISVDILVNAIEEEKIKTRGHGYDDYQYHDNPPATKRADGYIDIPGDAWEDFIFDKDKGFLYSFQRVPFKKDQTIEVRSGYVDIQISRTDFQKKVKIKTAHDGKRVHKQIHHFRKIYDAVKKSGESWVSPDEVLQYMIDHCDYNTGDSGTLEEFAVVAVDHNPDIKKSKLSYSIDGGAVRSVSFARFWNIIADFNNPKL